MFLSRSLIREMKTRKKKTKCVKVYQWFKKEQDRNWKANKMHMWWMQDWTCKCKGRPPEQCKTTWTLGKKKYKEMKIQ